MPYTITAVMISVVWTDTISICTAPMLHFLDSFDRTRIFRWRRPSQFNCRSQNFGAARYYYFGSVSLGQPIQRTCHQRSKASKRPIEEIQEQVMTLGERCWLAAELIRQKRRGEAFVHHSQPLTYLSASRRRRSGTKGQSNLEICNPVTRCHTDSFNNSNHFYKTRLQTNVRKDKIAQNRMCQRFQRLSNQT